MRRLVACCALSLGSMSSSASEAPEFSELSQPRRTAFRDALGGAAVGYLIGGLPLLSTAGRDSPLNFLFGAVPGAWIGGSLGLLRVSRGTTLVPELALGLLGTAVIGVGVGGGAALGLAMPHIMSHCHDLDCIDQGAPWGTVIGTVVALTVFPILGSATGAALGHSLDTGLCRGPQVAVVPMLGAARGLAVQGRF